MKDKLNITIRIADISPLALQINRDEEPIVRTAEYNVNKLWRAWTQNFSKKTPHEVLGMVAFQFAKAFEMLNTQLETEAEVLDAFDAELNKILLATDSGNLSPENKPVSE